METLLVTGGAGFIGSNFVRHCLTRDSVKRIVVLDSLTYAGNIRSLHSSLSDPRLRFVHADICESDSVAELLSEENIHTVVHFAAESHVDRSIESPDCFIRTNIVGTHSLLKAARGAWFRGGNIRRGLRFHHVSTDEVYGALEHGEPAFTEKHPFRPNSPYSASKAASDHLVRAYAQTYGLPVSISNCSNNYGPYQFPEKLIPLMIVNSLQGDTLPVYGDGENSRDWLHVDDHCRAIDAVITRGSPGKAYNIGGCNEHRNIDVVRLICRELDRLFFSDPNLCSTFRECPAANGSSTESLIRFVDDRRGHDLRYAVDSSLLSTELGFQPTEKFRSGLRKTIGWYLDNEDWWRSVLNGSYRATSPPPQTRHACQSEGARPRIFDGDSQRSLW